MTFQSKSAPDGTVSLDRDIINEIYRQATEGEAGGLLKYSEEQNVPADTDGRERGRGHRGSGDPLAYRLCRPAIA
jgi:hypothetical protein